MNPQRKLVVGLIMGFGMGVAIMGISNYINSPVGTYLYTQNDCKILLQAEKAQFKDPDYLNDSYFMRMWQIQNCNRFFDLEKEMSK